MTSHRLALQRLGSQFNVTETSYSKTEWPKNNSQQNWKRRELCVPSGFCHCKCTMSCKLVNSHLIHIAYTFQCRYDTWCKAVPIWLSLFLADRSHGKLGWCLLVLNEKTLRTRWLRQWDLVKSNRTSLTAAGKKHYIILTYESFWYPWHWKVAFSIRIGDP